MIRFHNRFSPAALAAVLALFTSSLCSAGDTRALEAAAWTTVVEPARQTLPGIRLNGSLTDIAPEDFVKLPKMAEEGVAFAAVILAEHSRLRLGDMKQTVRWLRTAVGNGDVDSAMALGFLYFPVGGAMDRSGFDLEPDAVLGYAWYAIGLSGMKTLEERGGKTRRDMRHIRDAVEELRLLLLPSERARVAAILSAWPESMPPDALPKPASDGRGAAATNAASLDETAIMENIRRWVKGEARDPAIIAALLQASPEREPAMRKAYERMRRLADAGGEEAEYLAAWCRFHGLGTDADEAGALPVLERMASAGEPEACFLAAAWALENGEKDRAVDLAGRAAEKGHARAMMLLSDSMKSGGDREQAARWMEKAAEAGNFAALEEMLGFAQRDGDEKRLVRWLTVLMIRAPDPAMAYRCRMLIAFFALDAGEEALQEMMAEGERWHLEHPAPGNAPTMR